MSLARAGSVLIALLAVIVTACSGGTATAPAPPTPAASVVSVGLASPGPTPRPTASPADSPSGQPQPTPRLPVAATTTAAPVAAASRVVVASYDIDLPVIAGDAQVDGNDPGYPLCDVAQYLTGYRQPAEAGTTYLYAHAQKGMFLPLLEASEREEGRELLGLEVLVYTHDSLVHRYEIFEVRRHATDYLLADSVRPGDQRLILQTSEGPRGTVPKLQVAARYLDSQPAPAEEAFSSPEPRPCP